MECGNAAPKALSPKGDCVVSTARIAMGVRRTYMHIHTMAHFSRCMMENRILERRRLLQLVALAVPALAVAGCATGGRRAQPPQFGGGNSDKSGNGGGPGGTGSRGGK